MVSQSGSPSPELGVYSYAVIDEFPLWASAVILGFGLLMTGLGLYMTATALAPMPTMIGDERVLVSRTPSMKPAYARMVVSIPFFGGAAYLIEMTFLPYVFPFVLFVIGLFLFFKGAMTYWANLHKRYTVTDRRIVQMYKFMWLTTKEIPTTRIISISEARNFFEVLTGRGSVIVASGVGSRQTIRIQEIDNPGPLADSIRQLMS